MEKRQTLEFYRINTGGIAQKSKEKPTNSQNDKESEVLILFNNMTTQLNGILTI